MTKFTTMQPAEKTKGKKTAFHSVVHMNTVDPTDVSPEYFLNVMFLYKDRGYGDVFLAWQEDEGSRIILFGKKGDEFD